MSAKRLFLILGDQLDKDSALLKAVQPKTDIILMVEVRDEATKVWSHKARIALFLTAMRHFASYLQTQGYQVDYIRFSDPHNTGSLTQELVRAIERHQPNEIHMIEAGEFNIQHDLEKICRTNNLPLHTYLDQHFLCSIQEFIDYAKTQKQLRLEFFYRMMRKRFNVLMENNQPLGGQWNYDSDNRETLPAQQTLLIPPPLQFQPDTITHEVLQEVELHYPDHPGCLNSFFWPITTEQAEQALNYFIEHKLSDFGRFQDAMSPHQPFVFHSLLSAALNLKLLHPLYVIRKIEKAYHDKKAPISSVEGFIRQILGWREYVRGFYWLNMPELLNHNFFEAHEPLPNFYWTGQTEMNCLKQTLSQTLKYGYAHHIQRLMVTGLYALLLGVEPKAVHEWYLAIYIDAVEWVELPNTLGMSQFADGGKMASKPYIASGKYIQRMSHYCQNCIYNPHEKTGESACPFTTLYWDFLIRHRKKLLAFPRLAFQLRNLNSLSEIEQNKIQKQAEELKTKQTL